MYENDRYNPVFWWRDIIACLLYNSTCFYNKTNFKLSFSWICKNKYFRLSLSVLFYFYFVIVHHIFGHIYIYTKRTQFSLIISHRQGLKRHRNRAWNRTIGSSITRVSSIGVSQIRKEATRSQSIERYRFFHLLSPVLRNEIVTAVSSSRVRTQYRDPRYYSRCFACGNECSQYVF